MSAVILNQPLLCECSQPEPHVHPNGEHFCSWCAGYLGNRTAMLRPEIHAGGICDCPAKCPADSHIRRRCR